MLASPESATPDQTTDSDGDTDIQPNEASAQKTTGEMPDYPHQVYRGIGTVTREEVTEIVAPISDNMQQLDKLDFDYSILQTSESKTQVTMSAVSRMTVPQDSPLVREHFNVLPGIHQVQLAMQAMLKEVLRSEIIDEHAQCSFRIQKINLNAVAQVGHTVQTEVAFSHQNIRNSVGDAHAQVLVGVQKENGDTPKNAATLSMTIDVQPPKKSDTPGKKIESSTWPTEILVQEDTAIGSPEGSNVFPDVRLIEFAQQSVGALIAQQFPNTKALAYEIENIDFGLHTEPGEALEAAVEVININITNKKKGNGKATCDVVIRKAGEPEGKNTSMRIKLRFMSEETFMHMVRPLEEKKRKGKKKKKKS